MSLFFDLFQYISKILYFIFKRGLKMKILVLILIVIISGCAGTQPHHSNDGLAKTTQKVEAPSDGIGKGVAK